MRPWNRTISAKLLHNFFVVCYVSGEHIRLAVVDAVGSDDIVNAREESPTEVVSGRLNKFPLMGLDQEDETVRLMTTPTAAIVVVSGKFNIFDFFAPRSSILKRSDTASSSA